MKRFTMLLAALLCLGIPAAMADSNTGTIRGYVRDVDTGEPMGAVDVLLMTTQGDMTVTTKRDGFFSMLSVPTGPAVLLVQINGKNAGCLSNVPIHPNETFDIGIVEAVGWDRRMTTHLDCMSARYRLNPGQTQDVYDVD